MSPRVLQRIRQSFAALHWAMTSPAKFAALDEALMRFASTADADAPTPESVGAMVRVLIACRDARMLPLRLKKSGDAGLQLFLSDAPHIEVEALDSGKLDVYCSRAADDFDNWQGESAGTALALSLARVRKFLRLT